MFVLSVALVYCGTAVIFLAAVWLTRPSRRKGVILVGEPVRFESSARFDVGIHGVTQPVAGFLSDERRLSLMVTSDGVAVEVDIDDGGDLLRELYEGRTWLHELEGAV